MLLLENLTCRAEADAITFTAIHFLVNHKLSPKTSSFEVNSRCLFKIQYFYIVANTFLSDTQNINRFFKKCVKSGYLFTHLSSTGLLGPAGCCICGFITRVPSGGQTHNKVEGCFFF